MHLYPTVTDRKIRIAVVGCGRISRNHFGSIEKHAEHLELVAVCDIDPAVLAEHVEQHKVAGYLDLEEMLEKRIWTWSLCALLAASTQIKLYWQPSTKCMS